MNAPGMFRSRYLHAAITVVLGSMLFGQGCPSLSPPPSGGNNGNQNPPPVVSKYAGSADCYICHANQHTDWGLTAHARAYETLKFVGQENNPVCLTCHTTGYDDGGFIDEATTPALAGVGCEACHGPSADHRSNVTVAALRPPVTVAADMCTKCHNGFHHNTGDEWASSRHGRVTPAEAESFVAGNSLNSCGECHSGDFRLEKLIKGATTVADTLLVGRDPAEISGVTCAVCHDPHRNTGNAVLAPAGHDYQLRYPEIASPEPTNTIAAVTDAKRFEGCGQCHHSRGRVWSDSRGPHHSIQANFYTGEMPAPAGEAPLVPNTRTVHRFVFKQCVTCHMQHEEKIASDPDEVGDLHAGHSFRVESLAGCVTSGCHPSVASVEADTANLQNSVLTRIANIRARLGDPSTWEYSSSGGPRDQSTVPDEVKKVRFLIAYIESDGSLGVHNPEYARAILSQAEMLLTSIGK